MKIKRLALPVLSLLVALAIPASAAALEFEIVNESGVPDEDVYVTVNGTSFDVPGMVANEPKKLSEIPGQKMTVETLHSGRVYISYGAPVQEGVGFDSPTRFDWAELTVTPNSSDVANLTAVDQYGIGMRLDTYGAGESHLEEVGSANSDTVFNALQQIPGGPQATVRDGSGNILRVLSPLHSSAYPDLGEYVKSMAGQAITLHTAFFGEPFTISQYTGTFAADGSITLSGSSNPGGAAPATISLEGAQLIADIYTGANTPNDLEGAIRRDVLAGISTGFWGGKYGNDALSFCSNPVTTAQGSWCPDGFNQPAFGDARASLSGFPTCEQYAAVINQYSDVYGNPYSDAAKKVTVGLDQPGSGGDVETLRLTVLPDSGDAQPVAGGNPNCGAAAPSPAAGGGAAKSTVRVKFFEKAWLKGQKARVGKVICSSRCGRVQLVAKRGRKVLGRGKTFVKGRKRVLVMRLTKPGRRAMADSRRAKLKLVVRVRQTGAKPVRRQHKVLLIKRR